MCRYILPLPADTITPVQPGIFVTCSLCQIQCHTKHSRPRPRTRILALMTSLPFIVGKLKTTIIMRPSSLGGGRILRRTLSVRLSVCLSVCPSVPLSLPSVTSFRQPLASRMYFSARTEGRISYGHLGRKNSC